MTAPLILVYRSTFPSVSLNSKFTSRASLLNDGRCLGWATVDRAVVGRVSDTFDEGKRDGSAVLKDFMA